MPDPKERLRAIHEQLRTADDELAHALGARARAVQELRALMQAEPAGFHALPSETETLTRAQEQAKEFPATGLGAVYREVFSATASLLSPVRVTYLGPEGGFGHAAARTHFGSSAELRPVDSTDLVFEEVARKRSPWGVVPLESTTDGALSATLHGLVRADVTICAEESVSTSYHLLSGTGNASDIEKVYGSPGAIAACERFLRTNFPRATVIDVPTGKDAASFARDDHGAAAVGNAVLAEVIGLQIVRERIEDVSGAVRYAIVGNELPRRTGKDRTVLALAVHDEPGALYKALKAFADRSINLSRLESRPAQEAAWRYVFFVELDGHLTDRPVVTAVEELKNTTRFVKVLGSYPRPG